MGAVRKPTCGPSRSDSDWRVDKALKKCAGLVFACTSSTMPDLQSEVFDLPLSIGESCPGIRKGLPVFLLDSADRRLYGIFEAASNGGSNMDASTRENIDSSNVGKVVSLPHIQVRLCHGAVVSALDEEKFRPVLGNGNDQKSRRIDLTQYQVQRLYSLFDTHSSSERKQLTAAKNRSCLNSASIYREAGSPKVADRSDYEYSSDSSSRGGNSGEDECIDEVINKKVHMRGHKDTEEVLTERLYQVALNDPQSSNNRHSKKDEHLCKEPSQIVENSPMLLRLQDNDPAVSSSNCNIPNGINGISPVNRQDALDAVSMMPPSVICTEGMHFIPDQAVQSQRKCGPNSGHSKWTEQKPFLRGSGNYRKQGYPQGRLHRPKDVRHRRQQMPLQSHQHVPFRSQKVQFNPFFIPFQISDQVHGQEHLASYPMCMQIANDIQIHPERLQQLTHHDQLPITLRYGPAPIKPENSKALHKDILQFARMTRPSPEVQLPVEAAIDCVRQGVKKVWPEADMEVFGSFSTGLCLQHSDVDLVVDAPRSRFSDSLPMAQVSASLIRELAVELRKHEWCESINPLENASMPVLKCLCRPFGPASKGSISVDITIGWSASQLSEEGDKGLKVDMSNYHTGSAARDYVLSKIRELPALAPLVLLLKSYLHHKGLSNVYSGGLGSFSLTLLVAFYLEVASPVRIDGNPHSWPTSPTSTSVSSPLFSSPDGSDDSDTPSSSCNHGLNHSVSVSENSTESLGQRYVRQASKTIEDTLTFWEKGCTVNLSECNLATLLLGFLHSFGFELDLSCEKIVLKGIDGSKGGISKRIDRHCALWIDDPLRPGINVGAGSFAMVHVQHAFKEMFQVIVESPVPFSSLQCDRSDCQDLAVLNQLPLLSRLAMETEDCH